MAITRYRPIEAGGGYYAVLSVLLALVAAGAYAAHFMDVNGHYVTGMNNQIVWGVPHVFAVFLIVAASGALNVASMASVFGRLAYKPLSRLSALLAITLLVGGLAVLVLDLGRPDRLIVAMTHYNFRSIFAWNIFLYTGFIVIVALYLWLMFEPRLDRYASSAGIVAFVWRIVLTTGTGSIFGFLVAREAYDAAIMAPLFVAMSLSFGTAVFIVFLMALCRGFDWQLGDAIVMRLGRLLGIFVATVLYLSLAQHLTSLYAAEHHRVERFLLLEGGVYTAVFWLVQVVLGGLLPLALFYLPRFQGRHAAVALGAALVLVGGLAQLYVIIIGGQAYPLTLLPGMQVSSSFFDGVVASYAPSLPEIALGVGGVALALLIVMLAMRVLAFVPVRLEDMHAGGNSPESEPQGLNPS